MSEFIREQGFGCMGFSAFYSSSQNATIEQGKVVLDHALNNGVTLLNSANFYGRLNVEGYGDNLRFIRSCLEGKDRSSYQLMVKIGMDTKATVEDTGKRFFATGSAEYLQADVDFALRELNTDYIDIIVLCRVPSDVPIEDAVSSMQSIIDQGKARHIGLSEASAHVLRKASAVAKIYCVEQEWSLWSRDAEEDVIPTCRELGIKIVAYSPLGRGFLTGSFASRSELDPTDFRFSHQPKFAEGNFDKNLQLVDAVRSIASRKNCTPGQIALAWVHAQGTDVIPIPGTTSLKHLEENIAARSIVLSAEDMEEINAIFSPEKVEGGRYASMHFTFHANKASVETSTE